MTTTFLLSLIDYLGILTDALVISYLLGCLFFPRMTPPLSGLPRGISSLLKVLFLTGCIYLVGFSRTFFLFTLSIFLACFLSSLLFYQGDFCMKVAFSLLFTSVYFLTDGVYLSLFTYFAGSLTGEGPLYVAVFAFQRIVSKSLIILLLRPFLRDKELSQMELPRAYKACLGIYCGFDCMILLVNIFWLAAGTEPSPAVSAVTFGFLAIIVCFFLMFLMMLRSYRDNLDLSLMAKERQLHGEYLQQAQNDMANLRSFRHDMKAHLFCMQGLLEQEKYEELREYLAQFSGSPFLTAGIPSYCPDDTVNTLLVQKKRKAKSQGVPLSLDIRISNQIQVRRIDLCAVLSNLCDNAIEAAAQTGHPFASLEVKEVKGYISIRTKNSAQGNVLLQTPTLATTKADRLAHGHGLAIVQSIVRAYRGSLDTRSEEGSFTCQVLLENLSPQKTM